jgi:hypothetical protein
MAIDRFRRCGACGEYHWESQWPDNHTEAPGSRSDLAAPGVITDSQQPLRSMADGKVYDSKSAMRRSYRADGNPQGVEYIEVGNDPQRFKPKPKPKPDIKAIDASIGKAISKAKMSGLIK